MVDLILLGFTAAMFAGGFWCGAKFGTYSQMAARAKTWAKAQFKD